MRLADVSAYPRLLSGLARHRWSEEEIRLVVGGNVLRVLGAAAEFAAGGSPLEPLGRAPA